MKIIIVAHGAENWGLNLPDVEIVSAHRYITDPKYMTMRSVRVINLAHSYRYQSSGYYVSLLAAARGHRPMPTVATMRDLQGSLFSGIAEGALEELIEKSLSTVGEKSFTLVVCFGHTPEKQYEALAMRLFNLLTAPLLRVDFVRGGTHWHVRNIRAIPISEVPGGDKNFLVESLRRYCERPVSRKQVKTNPFSLAMLVDPVDPLPPSNKKALEQFMAAGQRNGIDVELIHKDDYNRLLEYDALFIRDTTQVNNHTFRFARRAETEGMPSIDDSMSILRCTNKVYLAELLARHRIRTPKTILIYGENVRTAFRELGFPCILKQPDSSFSLGVYKVNNEEEFTHRAHEMLTKSDLIIGQEFMPTPFDWRIGIIDREPLFACKYFMAEHHWQIYNKAGRNDDEKWGMTETFSLKDVPVGVLKTAMDAADLIGSGLYGVDLKEVDGVARVIEINDNPSIDSGIEDEVLGAELYNRIMQVFHDRIIRSKR